MAAIDKSPTRPDTTPNVGVSVPGILAPGTYNGVKVDLLPYFNGQLASSNRGGSAGVAINFLDGGGAAPLQKNMPADDAGSNQYFLLTHLYQFFGSLLGCSEYSMAGFPAYDGFPSMYAVHRFMDLGPNQLGYFIEQVALSAQSFGVAEADLAAVGEALGTLFGHRCAPNATAIAAQGPQQQSICTADDCPAAPGAVCDQYQPAVKPMNATMSGGMGTTSTGSPMGSSTGSPSPSTSMPVQVGAGTSVAMSVGGLLAGVCAALFF